MQDNTSKCKWMQDNTSEWKWMQDNTSECKWMQACDDNRLYHMTRKELNESEFKCILLIECKWVHMNVR